MAKFLWALLTAGSSLSTPSPALRFGMWSQLTLQNPMPLPALLGLPKDWFSLATRAQSLASEAMFLPTMRKLENWPGAPLLYPAIPRVASNPRLWRPPRERGTASGGRGAVAAHHGIPSSMILNSISSTPARETEPHGTELCAARVVVTISTSLRSLRCAQVTAKWYGTFRLRREITGTTTPRSP